MRVLFLIMAIVSLEAFSSAMPFENLKELKITGGYEELAPRVFYQPSLSAIIHKTTGNTDVFEIHAIDTYAGPDKTKPLKIIYTEGDSADPSFRIITGTDQFTIDGYEIYIPGNGYIYTSGHANNLFNEHRKYHFINNQLIEVKQPYLYVGLQTTTTKNIAIYSDTSYLSKVATLTKNQEITVLVNKDDNFLVKTPFGLTGWYKIEQSQDESATGIKGLYFRGD